MTSKRALVPFTASRLATCLLVGLVAGSCKKTEPPPPPEPAKPPEAAPVPTGKGAALTNPAKLTEQAPAKYRAKFTTSKGDFVVEVHREWAPQGADRFYNLVKSGYYDDTRFFRVIKGFMVQWGIHGDGAVNQAWQAANIPDDPVRDSNKRGNITFAKSSAPNSRTAQVFINYV